MLASVGGAELWEETRAAHIAANAQKPYMRVAKAVVSDDLGALVASSLKALRAVTRLAFVSPAGGRSGSAEMVRAASCSVNACSCSCVIPVRGPSRARATAPARRPLRASLGLCSPSGRRTRAACWRPSPRPPVRLSPAQAASPGAAAPAPAEPPGRLRVSVRMQMACDRDESGFILVVPNLSCLPPCYRQPRVDRYVSTSALKLNLHGAMTVLCHLQLLHSFQLFPLQLLELASDIL